MARVRLRVQRIRRHHCEIAWLAFAFAFSAYVDTIANGSRMYGAFAGIVALELYLYWSAVMLLVGAQIDHELGVRGRTRVRRLMRMRRTLT